MTPVMFLALVTSAVITWRAMSRLLRVPQAPTQNVSRRCLNCGEPECDHANGQCLFDTTKFMAHRLQGVESHELWAPVVVDVHIDQTAHELNKLLDKSLAYQRNLKIQQAWTRWCVSRMKPALIYKDP